MHTIYVYIVYNGNNFLNYILTFYYLLCSGNNEYIFKSKTKHDN